MDEADRGQISEARFREDALRRRRPSGGDVRQYCIDCGDEIPKARRMAAVEIGMGCERCVACQTQHERSAAWG